MFPSSVPNEAELRYRQVSLAIAIDDLEARMSDVVGQRDRYPVNRFFDWRCAKPKAKEGG